MADYLRVDFCEKSTIFVDYRRLSQSSKIFFSQKVVYVDVGDDDVDDGDDVDDDDVDDDDVDHDDVEVRAFGPRAGPQTTKRGELLCLKIYLCGECGHKF